VAEIPPHLDTAQSAFAQVAGALAGFADVLADAKGQMAGICADAEQTFGSLAGARVDRAGLREPSDEETAANPAARTAYEEDRRALDGRIDQLRATWDETAASAAGVNARVREAARQAGLAIRAAGRTSPTAGQGWLEDAWEKGQRRVSGWLDDLKGFVAEHAEVLRGLAKVMRVVGIALVAVGAVLAVLGVGTVVMTAGFVLWGAGDALEATVDWAEGKITGRQLLFRAGVAIGFSVAGGVAGKVIGKGLERLAPGWRRSAPSSGWPTQGRRSPAPSRPRQACRRPVSSRARRWPPTASRP
jgi:hypothetical protein